MRRLIMAEVIPFVVQETTTVTEMEKIAERVRAAVDAVAELIPRLESPHPITRKGVRAHRTVPREFIAAMIAAVEQLEQLQVVDKFDTGDARETLQFLDAFVPSPISSRRSPRRCASRWSRGKRASSTPGCRRTTSLVH